MAMLSPKKAVAPEKLDQDSRMALFRHIMIVALIVLQFSAFPVYYALFLLQYISGL